MYVAYSIILYLYDEDKFHKPTWIWSNCFPHSLFFEIFQLQVARTEVVIIYIIQVHQNGDNLSCMSFSSAHYKSAEN